MKNYFIVIRNIKSETAYTYVVYARDYKHAKQLGYSLSEELQIIGLWDMTDVVNIDITMADLEVD